MKTYLLLAAALLLAGCPQTGVRPESAEVRALLALPDERPVASITIADASEIALLEQQLKLTPIRRDGQKLFFVADPEVIARLRVLDYLVASENPQEAYRRLVRVEGAPSQEVLSRNGVKLINREKSYVIVDGTLVSLRGLAAAGWRIAPLKGNEPRPREVRITVPSRSEIQRVADLHVDIYSVEERDRQITLHAGAFDAQIDALRARGYTVSAVSTVP